MKKKTDSPSAGVNAQNQNVLSRVIGLDGATFGFALPLAFSLISLEMFGAAKLCFGVGMIAAFVRLVRLSRELTRKWNRYWVALPIILICVLMFYTTYSVIFPWVESRRNYTKSDLVCVMWGRDELRYSLINQGSQAAVMPKHWTAVIDFSRPYFPPSETRPNYLPTVAMVESDYVAPGEHYGMIPVLNTDEGKAFVHFGDILSGFLYVRCGNCLRTRAYYFHFEIGQGGWYAEAPDWKDLRVPLSDLLPTSRRAIERYEDKYVPASSRITMPKWTPGDEGKPGDVARPVFEKYQPPRR